MSGPLAPATRRSPSQVPTEVDSATWEHWPRAPTDDFARLIPDNQPARNAFRNLVQGLARGDIDQTVIPAYSIPYIHWEFAADHVTVSSSESETEPPSDASFGISPPGRTSDADMLPITGFYRFNSIKPTPQNHKIGWIPGLGRRNLNVEFILAPKSYPRVHSRHLRIVISQSGLPMAISDGHPFYVDGNLLRRRTNDRTDPDPSPIVQPPDEYQRLLRDGSTLMIGDLLYRLRICAGRGSSIPMLALTDATALLTPTPHLLDDYMLWPPFARGTYGTIAYAANITTGAKVVIKRITTVDSNTRATVLREVEMLRSNSHVSSKRTYGVATLTILFPS